MLTIEHSIMIYYLGLLNTLYGNSFLTSFHQKYCTFGGKVDIDQQNISYNFSIWICTSLRCYVIISGYSVTCYQVIHSIFRSSNRTVFTIKNLLLTFWSVLDVHHTWNTLLQRKDYKPIYFPFRLFLLDKLSTLYFLLSYLSKQNNHFQQE